MHFLSSQHVRFRPLPPGAIAGIVDQPMQNFQRTWDLPGSAGSTAKGLISGVGKGIVGVFTKPIGGAAELVSQTGYGGWRMMMMMMMEMGGWRCDGERSNEGGMTGRYRTVEGL